MEPARERASPPLRCPFVAVWLPLRLFVVVALCGLSRVLRSLQLCRVGPAVPGACTSWPRQDRGQVHRAPLTRRKFSWGVLSCVPAAGVSGSQLMTRRYRQMCEGERVARAELARHKGRRTCKTEARPSAGGQAGKWHGTSGREQLQRTRRHTADASRSYGSPDHSARLVGLVQQIHLRQAAVEPLDDGGQGVVVPRLRPLGAWDVVWQAAPGVALQDLRAQAGKIGDAQRGLRWRACTHAGSAWWAFTRTVCRSSSTSGALFHRYLHAFAQSAKD